MSDVLHQRLIRKLIMEVLRNCREKEEEEEEEEKEAEEEEEVVGEDEILKRRISTHPSYGLLVEAHLGCLKVGENGEILESYHTTDQKQQENSPSVGMASRSELDHFMEAYCLALRKLKEAMEEPQQKSMAFINNMHSQLKELTSTHPVPADHHPATTSAE